MQRPENSIRRLGVMGGTFDPIHVGHLIAASEALWEFDLDRVLFVPAGRPWQKSSYAPAEDRFLMTVTAAGSHPRFGVSRIELDRRGLTYTVDTMEALRDFYGPEIELAFIVGSDAATQLGTWQGLERLAGLTEMIVATRPGFQLEALKSHATWPTIRVMKMPGVAISSTEIRERVRVGRPIDYLVPAGVASYIRERGLYVEERKAEGA